MRLVEAIEERRYRPGERQRRHEHPYASLSLVLKGAVEEVVSGRRETAYALGVVLKPAGVAHEDRFGDTGGVTLHVRIADGGMPAGSRWRWCHGGPAAARMLGLLRLRRGEETAAPDADAHVADALAALSEPSAPALGAPPWLLHAKEMIDDAPRETSVAELACAAGVHPVYLARQFRRHFGIGVSGYVRRRRLCRAASLAGRERSLTAAAHAAGFADLAHLCREFKRETNLTAGEFARMVGNVQARRPSVSTFPS